MQENANDAAGDELADRFDLAEVHEEIARDVGESLRAATQSRAVFVGSADPDSIIRAVVKASIRDITAHDDGRLLQRLIEVGSHDDGSPLPPHLDGKPLTSEEIGRAVTFVYSFMVNAFKGGLTELLAAGPCSAIVDELRRRGSVPAGARLFVGDSVSAFAGRHRRLAKAADFHILATEPDGRVRVCGVAEVKSFHRSLERLDRQLDQHIARASAGMAIDGQVRDSTQIVAGSADGSPPLRIAVTTERWPLSREFRIDGTDLHDPRIESPVPADVVEEVGPSRWHVRLRWSREALAAVALEMSFWYMGEVGRVLYARAPREWVEMEVEAAGQNATKLTLYNALLRLKEGSSAQQRAIALYNAYGFGYSLGMNFIDASRRRQMLWFEHLKEIAATGRTRDGCRIRGLRGLPRSSLEPGRG